MTMQDARHKQGSDHPDHERLKQHLSDSSRALADLTASMVYDNPGLLKLLVEISILEKDPWSHRASRIVSICCCQFPELFKPYSAQVIRSLKDIPSEGARRNYLKIFAEIPVRLNRRDKSVLVNLCFDYLAGEAAIAVQVYSMEILYNLSRELPEIGIELSSIIEDKLPEASAGYKSRSVKILRKLQRDNFKVDT